MLPPACFTVSLYGIVSHGFSDHVDVLVYVEPLHSIKQTYDTCEQEKSFSSINVVIDLKMVFSFILE